VLIFIGDISMSAKLENPTPEAPSPTRTDATETNSSAVLIDSKFTADQIETDCPVRLQEIRREIAERLIQEMRRRISERIKNVVEESFAATRNDIDQLMAEANALCDREAFILFCEKLKPYVTQVMVEFPQPTVENSK
jgi:hypothetical protein